MNASAASLDKALITEVDESFGSIAIRVVVLGNKAIIASPSDEDELLDLEPDEVLDESDSKRPIDSFLESPKRGKYCCVFLVNGQRQHAWDNTFIVRDLELKYLRNRMMVIVDIDGLRPEAIAMLMQGSRHQFYEGEVYSAISRRVIATLKGDPDLIRLEEQAEQEISSLKTGDEVVKAALDQLIESHHDASPRTAHGHAQSGDSTREDSVGGSLPQTLHLVVEGDQNTGQEAEGPALGLTPDLAVLRFKPGEHREVTFNLRPSNASLDKIQVTTNPLIPELSVSIDKSEFSATVGMEFVEPEGFDEDQYPIHAVLKAVALIKGYLEPRIVERPVVISLPREIERKPRPAPELLDQPTMLRITSRQPIQMIAGGPDLHVKLRWNGKDELASGVTSRWQCNAQSTSGHEVGQPSFTTPMRGKFELLLRAPEGVAAAERITILIEAVGDGTTLKAEFEVEVIAPPSPRRIEAKWAGGAQRSPPYELSYVSRKEWAIPNCWNGATWTQDDPGAFLAATENKPLVLIINEDYGLYAEFREELTARRLAESTIQERKTRYTSHIAYHLWQMHKSSESLQKEQNADDGSPRPPSEDEMREEIKRVASTLIRLTRLT